jgi:hypothetical protein
VRRALASAAAAALAALATGCGGDASTLLRDADAAGLKESLGQVRRAVAARDVSACARTVRELRQQVVTLRPPIDRELRRRLREEIDTKLIPEVEDECDDPKTETLQTTTTPAPTGPTGPAEPEPEPEPEPPAVTTGTVPAPPVEPEPEVPPAEEEPEIPAPDTGGFGEDGEPIE